MFTGYDGNDAGVHNDSTDALKVMPHQTYKWPSLILFVVFCISDGVLEDMSLASRILEDNFYSPWRWPRG